MNDANIDTSALDKLFAGTSAEDVSKEAFFTRVAEVAEAMIDKHGSDFAMGVLVLSARFIAEGKPLIKRDDGASTTSSSLS